MTMLLAPSQQKYQYGRCHFHHLPCRCRGYVASLRVLFIIFSLIFTLATIMRKSRVPARGIKHFLRPTTKILLQFTYKPCRAINQYFGVSL